MSERAEALARRLEQTNDALIGILENCSEAQWRAMCAE